MTLTLVTPLSGYTGWGARATLTTDLGAAGDYLVASLDDPVLSLQGAVGSTNILGDNVTFVLRWGLLRDGTVDFDGPVGLDLGHALTFDASHFDASNALVDSFSIAGFFHDPVTCVGALLSSSGAGHDPMLDTILAAVQASYTNSP